MKTRQEIEELSIGNKQTAILEVLLDIRDLLNDIA